jgi:hypothetical protein
MRLPSSLVGPTPSGGGDLGARQEHLAAALEAMRSALSVWTADGFPADHADSTRTIERIEAELREAEA